MGRSVLAQFAERVHIPLIILRIISDNADESAVDNFLNFVKNYEYLYLSLIKVIFDGFEKN